MNVMSEWRKVRLGDVCDISSSKRIFAKEYVSDGIPFYRGKEIIEKHKGNNISTELYISKQRYIELKNRVGVPAKGDILLTSVGTIGVPWVVNNEEFYFKDGNLTWLKAFNGINNQFLYYWIISPLGISQIDQKQIGSTQKALTIDSLRKFELDLPPLSEQKRIADILGSLDDKIELNNRINSNLESQAQALFKRWFVDFEFPDVNGNPYKSSGGEFIDSELGGIPKGWKVMELSDVSNLIAGGDKPKVFSLDPNEECNIPIYSNGISMEGLYGYTNTHRIYDESVTVSARGTIGFVCLRLQPYVPIVRLIAIVPKTEILSAKYIYFWIRNININGTGTTQQQLTVPDFKRTNVLIPITMIMQVYTTIIDSIFIKIESIKNENTTLVKLRNTLLPKLITNEIKL